MTCATCAAQASQPKSAEGQQGRSAHRGAGVPERARTLLVAQRHGIASHVDRTHRRGRGVAPVDPSRIDASFSLNDDFVKEKP